MGCSKACEAYICIRSVVILIVHLVCFCLRSVYFKYLIFLNNLKNYTYFDVLTNILKHMQITWL